MLDPGHGGTQSGAVAPDGITMEKDLNLKIARYLKAELERYEDVKVRLTREDDIDVDLDERSELAEQEQADILISLHNNAYGGQSKYDHGSFVLASKGQYKKTLADEEQKLACNILYELSEIGLEDQGILIRESETGEVYPNGEQADYYRIVKAGINNDRMQILIEHAYIDDKEDFEQYLSSEKGLRQLARADAQGIARYYGLKNKKTGETLEKLKNREEKIVLFCKDGTPVVRTKTFYEDYEFVFPFFTRDFPFRQK